MFKLLKEILIIFQFFFICAMNEFVLYEYHIEEIMNIYEYIECYKKMTIFNQLIKF